MKKFSILALVAVVLGMSACNPDEPTNPDGSQSTTDTDSTTVTDYSKSEAWFQTGKAINPDLLDVFYLIPTAGSDWVDENGMNHHILDITNPDHRAAMEQRFGIASPIFGDSTNLFSPYYQQITLEVWAGGEDSIKTYYPTAFADVKAAFDYYMANWNNGRKFVIAGFSQGAKGVKELVKTMTDEQFALVQAVYVIGFPILQEDLDAANGDRFKPAQGADDLGVTISYNSVDDENGISDIFRHSQMIINPANWSTDTEVAQVNDTVINYISKEHMVLFVDGVDPDPLFMPEAATLFPKGCFHLLELPLYAPHLRENVKLRLYK